MKGCSFIQNTSDDHAWCTVHVCREIKCIKAERDRAIKVVEVARLVERFLEAHNPNEVAILNALTAALRDYDGGGR